MFKHKKLSKPQYFPKGNHEKKCYLGSEIVSIFSDNPTIEMISEHLDSEYW